MRPLLRSNAAVVWTALTLLIAGLIHVPPLVGQSESDARVELIRIAVSGYRSMLRGDALLDPCSVERVLGRESDGPPVVPSALEGLTHRWDESCPFRRTASGGPPMLEISAVLLDRGMATVRLFRDDGQNGNPYTMEIRGPWGEWRLQRITVEPSMAATHHGYGRDLPDGAARAIQAIEAELEGRSLAVDRRQLVQFRAEGLGLTGHVQLIPDQTDQFPRLLEDVALPDGDFPAALRCLVAEGTLEGAWAEWASEVAGSGEVCGEPRPDLTFVAAGPRVHTPPDQSYGFRVRVYGAGTLGLLIWDVFLDRAFEVKEVRMLLSVG